MEQKIDFIITWVDGNDKEWRKEKDRFNPNKKEDNRNVRYREWGTLKYWFRGVEKFAPWVNKIHFVTWGHLPSWLNVDHPKINIVNHRDFIPSEFLPTFNSRVIELNFHNIKGLSENFVYFNDDMFILNEVKETDFFKNNLPCDSFIMDVTTPFKDTFNYALFNNMVVINNHFNKRDILKSGFFSIFNFKYRGNLLKNFLLLPWSKFTGMHIPHIPTAYNKKTFFNVWDIENEILLETCRHQFRNTKDVNHFLFRYWQLMTNEFIPSKTLGKSMPLGENNSKVYNAIRKQKYNMICVNDSDVVIEFEEEKEKLHDAFRKVLPERSAYEL